MQLSWNCAVVDNANSERVNAIVECEDPTFLVIVEIEFRSR